MIDAMADGNCSDSVFGRLITLLNRLDAAHIHYRLGHTRPHAVMVEIALPGWHWEVEFMTDGSVEIERYQSAGGVGDDPAALEEIFTGLDQA